MSLSVKIGLLAAVTALFVSVGGVVGLVAILGSAYADPFHVPFLIALVTPVAAFFGASRIVKRRIHRKVPVLGPMRGGLLAFGIFAAGVFAHAALRPGAMGITFSFLGQFVVAFLVMGWVAILAGCAVGILAERLAGSSA